MGFLFLVFGGGGEGAAGVTVAVAALSMDLVYFGVFKMLVGFGLDAANSDSAGAMFVVCSSPLFFVSGESPIQDSMRTLVSSIVTSFVTAFDLFVVAFRTLGRICFLLSDMMVSLGGALANWSINNVEMMAFPVALHATGERKHEV